MGLKSSSLQFAILIVVSFMLFSSGIDKLDIYSLDEAKNVEAAREMLANTNLVVPTYNGKLRVDKPPLHYYFIITGFKIFGVNAFGARFFSSIMGVLTVLLIFLFVRKNVNYEIGFYAALLLLTSLHFNIQMHMAVPDPYLIFILTFCGVAFYEFYENKGKIWWWLFYIFIGLGVLTKGPVAIILTGLTVFIYLLLKKEFTLKNILKINPFFGLVISLALAFPWYYLVHIKTQGAFTEGFFFKHNLQRFSNKMEGHGGLFLITLLFVALGTLPYTFFLFNKKEIKKTINKNKVYLFSVSYSIAVIVFFVLSSTRLPNYTVPAYPWLFILIAGIILKIRKKRLRWHLIAILIFSILLNVVAVVGLKLDKTIPHLYYLGFFFLIIILGAFLALLNQNKGRKIWLKILITSWGIFILLFFYVLYPKIDANNPIAKSRHLFKKEETVVGYKIINSAYVFELKKEIPVFNTLKELKLFIKQNKGNGKVITRLKYREDLKNLKEVFRGRDLFENPTTVILEF